MPPGNLGLEYAGDGTLRVRPDYAKKPIVQLTWDAARLYCEWRGKRLPTEAEFEMAMRGTTSRRFPWGDEDAACADVVLGRYEGLRCASLPHGPQDVESSPRDWTPEGIADLGGNVSEWVYDAFELPYYPSCGDCVNPRHDPQSPQAEEMRVFRGGAWANTLFAHTSARGRWKRHWMADNIGFRCAADGSPH
jgi:formylglycine-generating enzyme required for sulfatase activity